MSTVKNKPIVLVDMDGVIAHWEKQFISDIKELDPTYPVIEYGQRTGFEIVEKDGKEADTTIKVKTRPGFYADLEVIEGALQAFEDMEAAGLEVFICTAPSLGNPTCASDKHAWITKHFGAKWTEKVIITKDKTLVYGDVLIDDKPEVTGVMTPQWEHVVFDQSYNRHVDNKRINGWANWEDTLGYLLEKVSA